MPPAPFFFDMALNTANFIADYKVARSDIPESITFGGSSYSVVLSSADEGLEALMAGEVGDRRMSMMILLSDFGTAPVIGDTLTARSATWRVESYRDDPQAITRTYELTEANNYG